MKKLQFISLIISTILLFINVEISKAGDLPDGIVNSLKTGNAKELAKHFNANIDLTLIDKQEIYSKTQAELILKEFFSKNVPSNFTIIHQGEKEGSKYVIGNLTTSKGTFRVSLFLKSQDNTQVIHQLRIESGNE
ncbi:MAG: DUF4783 domain-containing protein [Bacteroidetes bacterium CG02_land_8_20_14_3_00_31_25]|nr:DUF4783 domain-containing protein [Bacteroidota bacterium]PIV58542.1 MAG: DUF4783 domain-containing protein [Bacteroidetes bacterium CG02_land_8_20_14_3_00_31_25]PIX35986.1 MAG: DUF4783 domain-containing protein [Bacteroidetes bacterium CG_4_8_14_3_um_filter_31_14]PIY05694.1 MAG: DUF4783 domain-containing protein [Bacteroidetes bacterium CG_4_10_14_3_um_filter_31_20]